MEPGRVAALFVSAEPGGPMHTVASVEAVAGRGLQGDRYFGDYAYNQPGDITLFAREDVDAANAAADATIDYADLRRNVMTVGIDLREIRGSAIRIGVVVVDLIAANPPCNHLQKVTGKPLLRPLVGRAGVRGRIRDGGTIREGDSVEWVDQVSLECASSIAPRMPT